jgi:hypothetical protein
LVSLEMSRKAALAAFFAGRAARILLAGSDPADAPGNTAAQVSDIILSNLVVREDASNGLVGYLYAVGTTAPVTFTITSDPDGIFAIVSGNELHKVDGFGTGTDYAITIKATETVGGTEYSEVFTVDVIPAETVVPDPPVGDGGGSGDVVVPDPEDPDSDTDPYVQPPVEVVTEIASKVSGKNGGTSVFLKDWGVPEAGGVYVLKYSADWTGMSQQGRYASVGFGFKQGHNFHMVGLRGNGAVMTTMLASRLYGDFRKAKQFNITNDGAAANGTRTGPNWLRLTIGDDGTTYTLESSADGDEWDLEIEDAAPAPLTNAENATQFGPAAYFYEEDKGTFVITISEFRQAAAFGAVLVKKAADQTGANYSAAAAVAWDTETFDVTGWHDTGSATSRITIPSGVNYVRLSACISFASVTATSRAYAYFTKNVSGVVPGLPINSKYFPIATANYINIVSAPIAVVAGDYFEVVVQCNSVTLAIEDFSWFAAERVG